MKKEFFGLGRDENGEYTLIRYSGNIIHYKDLHFGITKNDNVVAIELSTGLSILKEKTEVKYMNEIEPLLINGRYDLVVNMLNESYIKDEMKIYNELLDKHLNGEQVNIIDYNKESI